MRDYIHVMDLADGHVVAMEKLANKPGVHIYNLGAGVGSSVLDALMPSVKPAANRLTIICTTSRATFRPTGRTPAKPTVNLNWRVTRTLDEMAQDTWHWQSRHPQGYPD